MRRVHVLCDRFTNQNTSAILAPLVRYRGALRDCGIDVRLFLAEAPGLAEADLIIVVDRYLLNRGPSTDVAEAIGHLTDRVGPVAYFDTGDSSGLVRSDILPRVRGYVKPFVLRDRREYMRAHYGGRVFTDHYHRRHGVLDAEPQLSQPVTDDAHLARLHVGWSPAVYPYGRTGNRLAKLYRHLPLRALLCWPDQFQPPQRPRPNAVSCRISARHSRETVVHQRKMVARAVQGRVATGPIPRRAYALELVESRVVLSPFGWGEYAIRDYETFLAGAALLKPDMSHLETWPDLYQSGRTYLPIDWDLNSLGAALEMAATRPDDCVALAVAGQNCFRKHATDGAAFAEQVDRLVTALLATPRK